jgi:hypothetical protein
VQEFSLDVAMAWVDEACGGFFAKEQAGTLKQTDVYVFRVAAMLDDFAVHGSVLRRYSRSVSKLDAGQADVLAGFQGWLREEGCAVSTVRAYGTVVGEFLAFIATRGGLAALDGAMIGAFVTTLAGYQPKTVEHKLCAVRSLLRFAISSGLVEEGVLDTVPAVRWVKQARVPSVWDPRLLRRSTTAPVRHSALLCARGRREDGTRAAKRRTGAVLTNSLRRGADP